MRIFLLVISFVVGYVAGWLLLAHPLDAYHLAKSDSFLKGLIGFFCFFVMLYYLISKYRKVFRKHMILNHREEVFFIFLYFCVVTYFLREVMFLFFVINLEGFNFLFIPFAYILYIISPFVTCLPLLRRSQHNKKILESIGSEQINRES